MSRRGMRSEVKEKMNEALEAAAQKEGKAITDTLISATEFERMKHTKGLVVFDGTTEWLLADGRYIQIQEDVESGTMHYHIIDNLPVATLEALVLGKRDEVISKRNYEENEDRRYITFRQKESECETLEEYDALVNPVDQLQAERYFRSNDAESSDTDIDYYHGSPEQIVMSMMGFGAKQYHDFDYPTVNLESLPENLNLVFESDGAFDRETSFLLKRIIDTYYQTLDKDAQTYFRMIFCSGLPQVEIAKMRGVSPQAISKKKKAFTQDIADIFLDLGYPIMDEWKAKRSKDGAYDADTTSPKSAAGGRKRSPKAKKNSVRTYTQEVESVQQAMAWVYDGKDGQNNNPVMTAMDVV